METAAEPRPARLDWVMAALAVVLVGGFYIDLWAHSHGRVDDSFFTPWHAILYAAAFTIGVVLYVVARRARSQGKPTRQLLPHGYGLSLIGAALFVVAGILDLIWHEIFGFETSIEDLLSPTHLALATSGVLMVAGPARSAWHRGPSSRFPRWVPLALSLMAMLSILTAFTSYAHPATQPWPTVGDDRAAERSTLMLLDLETGNQTRLDVDVEGSVWMPSVFSDGSLVASVADRASDTGALYVMGSDGSHPIAVWEGEGAFHFADVSPDGSQIAFSVGTRGTTSRLYVVSADGGDPQAITGEDIDAWDPSWSPDGTTLVFTAVQDGDSDLWQINADGSGLTQFTDLEGDERAADWSPDGSKIVLESATAGRINLYTVDADGSNPVRLTDGDWFDQAPSWSPDGTAILFSSDRDGNVDLYTIPAGGGESQRLAEIAGSHDGWAGTAWMPDGETVVANTSGWNQAFRDEFNARVRGVTAVLIQSALMAGLLLLVLRRGRLPIGLFSLVFIVNGALMTVFDDNYWYVLPVAVAAAIFEVGAQLTRDWDPAKRVRTLAFTAPALWYAMYLIALALVGGPMVWSIHLTLGAPVLAGMVGLLLSLVVFPPAAFGADRTGPEEDVVLFEDAMP